MWAERPVDLAAQHVNVTGGQLALPAGETHAEPILRVAVRLQADDLARSPERETTPHELEQAGDLVGRVEEVDEGERALSGPWPHVAGRAVFAVLVVRLVLPALERERVDRRAVGRIAAHALAAEGGTGPVPPAPEDHPSRVVLWAAVGASRDGSRRPSSPRQRNDHSRCHAHDRAGRPCQLLWHGGPIYQPAMPHRRRLSCWRGDRA